jgi:hypothetical protein
VEKLKLIQNLKLFVSVESTGKNLEFNRYGNKWADVVEKIEVLKNNNIDVEFHSTLSNLTVIGFVDFYKQFSPNYKIHVTFVNQPTMMATHVLDDHTKEQIRSSLSLLPSSVTEPILASLNATPTDEEVLHLKQFLKQFIQRRPNLSLDIYPKSFVDWIRIENVE